MRFIYNRGVGDDEWKLDQMIAPLEEEVQAFQEFRGDVRSIKVTPTATTFLSGGSETTQTVAFLQLSTVKFGKHL